MHTSIHLPYLPCDTPQYCIENLANVMKYMINHAISHDIYSLMTHIPKRGEITFLRVILGTDNLGLGPFSP